MRRYRFRDEWSVEAPPEAVWELIGDPTTFPDWWPIYREARFLESRGYYIEWMRDEWLAEEDPVRAALMTADPEGALRLLAPEFKKTEGDMEDVFWRSRYAHP